MDTVNIIVVINNQHQYLCCRHDMYWVAETNTPLALVALPKTQALNLIDRIKNNQVRFVDNIGKKLNPNDYEWILKQCN